tara:strand:- start:174 stop:716 length:543 start_codon:yes stop_codon:yes gene_type:complete
MFIHKSHSKNELVKINNIFKLNIVNPKSHKKIVLSKLLLDVLESLSEIEPNEEYCIFNIIDLKMYLITCNPRKVLSIKEKNQVIMICKKLKHYARNGYDLHATDYNSIYEVMDDASYISKYGDIPSVRKACKELNMNHRYNYVPTISPIVQKELQLKDKYKQQKIYKLEVKRGNIILKFD